MAQIDLKNCDIYLEDGSTGNVTGTSLINHKLADPGVAPTAAATGGGATGGLLAAGDYLISYTYMTAYGETLRSPDSATLTVGATNIPRVTFPSGLPAGAVSRKLYISTPSGNRASEKLYASGITAITTDLAIAAPGVTNPPSVTAASLDYAASTTVVAVDGSTGAAEIGDRFSVTGSTLLHTVTAHGETLGATTSLTFTPAFDGAVADDAALTWVGHQLRIKIGEGNAQWTEKRNLMYTKDRGRLDTVKLGDEEPVEVKLDFTWVFLKADTLEAPTIEDVLKKRGQASGWVSSAEDPCEPYAIDVVIVYTPPCDAVNKEIYRLHDFRYEDLGHDIKQGQVSISGKCNIVEPVVTRAATYN